MSVWVSGDSMVILTDTYTNPHIHTHRTAHPVCRVRIGPVQWYMRPVLCYHTHCNYTHTLTHTHTHTQTHSLCRTLTRGYPESTLARERETPLSFCLWRPHHLSLSSPLIPLLSAAILIPPLPSLAGPLLRSTSLPVFFYLLMRAE